MLTARSCSVVVKGEIPRSEQGWVLVDSQSACTMNDQQCAICARLQRPGLLVSVISLFLISGTVHRIQKLTIKTDDSRQRGRIQLERARFFPVFSRLTGKSTETGSQQTAPTASQSGLCPRLRGAGRILQEFRSPGRIRGAVQALNPNSFPRNPSKIRNRLCCRFGEFGFGEIMRLTCLFE